MSSKTPATIAAIATTVIALTAVVGLTAAAQNYVFEKEYDFSTQIQGLSSSVAALQESQRTLSDKVNDLEDGQAEIQENMLTEEDLVNNNEALIESLRVLLSCQDNPDLPVCGE